MAFRDDRDALLARADALDAEVARLRDAADERDAARARAAELERERDDLRARLARLEQAPDRGRDAQPWMWRILSAGLVCVAIAIASTVVVVVVRSSDAPRPSRRALSTPPAAPRPAPAPDERPPPRLPAADEATREDLIAIRACLDGPDVELRVFLVAPAAVDTAALIEHARACRERLPLPGALPRPLDEQVAMYARALERVPDIVEHVAALGPQPKLPERQYENGINPLHRAVGQPPLAPLVRAWRTTSAGVRSWLRREVARLPRAEAEPLATHALALLDHVAFSSGKLDKQHTLGALRAELARQGDAAPPAFAELAERAERVFRRSHLSPLVAEDVLAISAICVRERCAARALGAPAP